MAEKKPVKMSDADLKFFEDMLIEKRREIVTAQSESEKAETFKSQVQAGDGGESNSADLATDYNALETNFELAAREGKYLVYLEEALKRIKKGTFGICKVCGQLIPKARLMAVPTATKCVNCKEETKKKEKEDSRLEMARLLAEEQRREMMKRNASK
ncbi:transcriptional regulator, TraR/DksA family [Fibrobacter sp. UWH9]|uniref:TraR/DksA family transcriptional regulator n=1 Tax=unclassified Fibrobacter TaxID=2634177 RepID=UPI0009114015|nr:MULTISPECIES: TraR/DksA C4-type zinc finger protein [Fibrobacter]MCQ2100762.1 TraR/DksA C4-type zinc finger protein [Fibrobacter sp.]MCL4102821.1 RNA polymerase-binding transcription factor DksA [Fibrobacter succinogenes]MDO4946628.1 TraR/DksA C4-type zinc finger protein [Fibrobacter sp.]OWV04250.1 conjugal transfer protein TraR [Fibrobacter sp. UWH3]OWV12490.1 conjugal transfer protein TraR [Fibrobacter sp. UWH1]